MLRNLCRVTFGTMLIIGLCFTIGHTASPDTTSVPGMQLNGTVVSDFGPVKGARIRTPGSTDYTVSDEAGHFTLNVPLQRSSQIVVTAGKKGWFNNGFRFPFRPDIGTLQLYPVPIADDWEYRFLSPQVCAQCHGTLSRYWDDSKMAHTTSNPKVIQMYTGASDKGTMATPGYKLDHQDSAGDCVFCHAPSAAVSTWGSKDLNTIVQTRQTEWDGVSCDYCHKINNVVRDENAPGKMKPLFRRIQPRQGNSILVFGPYDDVVNGYMAASYDPLQEESVFCATCHGHFVTTANRKSWDHSKIYTDAQWQELGLEHDNELPVQTTYQEWRMWQQGLPEDSGDLGKNCQSCHMSWRKDMLPYDEYIVDGHARSMMGVRRDPATIHPHQFDGTTATQLKTALSMEIEGETQGAILIARVHITNTGAGHWVPTGETMRSIMLLVKAVDSEGNELKMIEGPRLPKWTGRGPVELGNYSGKPGSAFARVLRDAENNLNVPFWKAVAVASDNRIPPKSTVTKIFRFIIVDPEDEPSVEARLVYRPVFKDWAVAKGWRDQDIEMTSSIW